MQPNLNIPQAPYVMYPSYKLPRTSVIDMSLDALMEHKLREVQNANRQQAVDSRTPTVLFDPLLNLRVRDYYREKYQRSLGSEVAGRAFGAVEGAALGLGIAATIAGIIIAGVSLLEPTPVGETVGGAIATSGIAKLGSAMPAITNLVAKGIPGAVAAMETAKATGVATFLSSAPAFLVGSGTIGAGIGGTTGLIGSDYTTYYATRDMFSNLIMPQSVGAGVLNSMNFVGQTMDMVGTGTVIKSTLYALINNESIAETIARAYGLHSEGRMEMNFSDIRESLGLDFGGVGNFFVDIAGEFSTDIGAIAGISPLVTGGIARRATAEVVTETSEAIAKAGNRIFREGFFDSKTAKPFLKAILDNDMDTFKVAITRANFDDVFLENLDDEIIEKFFKSVTDAASKKTAVKVVNAFKTIDVIDDTLTGAMWKISSPVVAGTYAYKKIIESNLIPKTLGKFLTDDSFEKIAEFFEGNSKVSRFIKNRMPNKIYDFLLNGYKSEMGRQFWGNVSFDSMMTDYANSLTDINMKKSFVDYIKSKRIKSIRELEKDGQYYEHIKDFFMKQLDEKQKAIDDLNSNMKSLSKDIRSGKYSEEEIINKIEELNKLREDVGKLLGDKDYIRLSYFKKHFDNPEEFEELSKAVTNIYKLNSHNRQYGLNDTQKVELEKHIDSLVKMYIKEHRTGKSSLATEYFDSFYKPIKKFINDNMSSAIKKEITDYFDDAVAKFNKESIKYSESFKSTFVKNMKRRIDKSIDRQSDEVKKAYSKFLEDFEKADTLDKKYSLVNQFLSETHGVDKKLTKKLSEGQDIIFKERAGLEKFRNTFKDVTNRSAEIDRPIHYSIMHDNKLYAENRRKYTDAIFKLFNEPITKTEKETFNKVIDILSATDEELNKILGMKFVSDADAEVFIESLNFINNVIGEMYKIKPITAKLTRLSFMSIPKLIPKLTSGNGYDSLLNVYDSIEKILKEISPRHPSYSLLNEITSLLDSIKVTKNKTLIKQYNEQLRELQKRLVNLINKDYKNSRKVLALQSKRLIKSLNNINRTVDLIKKKLEIITDADTISKLKTKLENYVLVKKSLEDLIDYSDTCYDGFQALSKYMDSLGSIDYHRLVNYSIDDFTKKINSLDGFAGKDISNYSFSLNRLINILELSSVKYEDIYRPLINYLGKLPEDISKINYEPLSKILKSFINVNNTYTQIRSLFKNYIPLKLTIENDTVKLSVYKGLDKSSKKIYDSVNKILNKATSTKGIDLISMRDNLEVYLKNLPNNKELIEPLQEDNPEFYRYLMDITDTPEKLNISLKGVIWKSEEIFKDVYNQNKLSSFVYKPSGFKNKAIFGSKIIVFDTETTGSTSNGLYSLTARVITFDKNGKAVMEKPISFYLADDAEEWKQWTIDKEVDDMYDGGVKSVVKKLNIKQRGHATSQELSLAFKSWLDTNHKDAVLMAHNAKFDFNELMNTMSGSSDETMDVINDTRVISPSKVQSFAKNNFEYAILDSNLMQNYLFLLGDLKFTTNTDLALSAKGIDVLEIKELSKYNTVVLFNGERVSIKDIPKIQKKSKKLLTMRSNENGTEALFNGGSLHEAINDVELMSAWAVEMFNKLGDMHSTFSDLDDATKFFDTILNRKHSEFLHSKEFGENLKPVQRILSKLEELDKEGYNYKKLQDLKHALEIITSKDISKYSYTERTEASEFIKDFIEDSRRSETNKEIINEDALKNITPTYAHISSKDNITIVSIVGKDGEFLKAHGFNSNKEAKKWIKNNYPKVKTQYRENPSTSYFTSQTVFSENDEFILNNEEIYSLNDVLSAYDSYETELSKQISVFKQMRSGREVGVFQQNKVYTMFQMAENFKYSDAISNLIDLFNGNKGGTLSGQLSGYAEDIAKVIDTDEFVPLKELRDELLGMQEAVEWYNSIINEINPAALDTFDNVMRMIEKDADDSDILLFIRNRAVTNNFNTYEMIQMYQKIINNRDKIMLPTAGNINNFYMKLKDDLTSILKRQEGNPEKIRNDLPQQDYIGRDVIKLVDEAIEDMRRPLRIAKARNRTYAMQPLTMKELDAYSRITEDVVKIRRAAGETNYDYGPEFKFTNEAHTIQPYEAVYRNSTKVFKYDSSVRPYQNLKRKVNAIESGNFKEMERAEDLPLVDYQNSRLSQLYALAAKTAGIDDITFINSIYNFHDYKFLGEVNPLFQDMFDSLLRNEITPEELGLDPTVFSKFVAEINSLNENSFKYIKDIKVLKNRLVNSLIYNVFKNKNYSKFRGMYNTKLFNTNHIDAYNESLKLFQDTISNFIGIDGTIDSSRLFNYFKNHPEYTIVFLDNRGKIHRVRASEDLFNSTEFKDAVFGKNNTVSIMSEDLFRSIAKDIQPQEIKNPIFRWAKNHILRNMKVLSLVNMNFMIQNAYAASMQNIISMEGVVNIPKFISSMVRTVRDYHKFKKIMMQVTSSKSISDFAGTTITSIETKWVDIIDDPEFLKTLEVNGEIDLVKLIKSLSKEDKEMLKELSVLSNTSAAYGEVNSITRNKQRELKAIKESEDAAKELMDKYGIDFNISSKALEELKSSGKYTTSEIENIRTLKAVASRKKYDNMSTRKLKSKLKEIDADINARGRAYISELRTKNIINDILNSRQYKTTETLYKYTGISKYLDINNDMETIFRLSAMRNYIDEGMTLDQATYEVIQRQFLYNDKSQAEQYAEFLVPFISYPLRMIKLAETMTNDSTLMDILFWMNLYSWDEEETEQQKNSEYLTKRRARGDVPIGDKLVQFGSPFNEGIMNFQNPLYSLNNKLNPLMKPFVDLATGEEHVRWNHLPVASQIDSVSNMIQERNIMNSFVNDFYRYNQFGNYYRPRINNKITGTFYNNLYTRTGKSRVSMNMQPLNSSNLKYRINDILYSGPKR